MKRLLASEVRRATARRLVRLAATASIIGIVIGSAITAANSTRPSADELARARSSYRASLQQCLTGDSFPPGVPPRGTTLEDFCRDSVLLRDYIPKGTFDLAGLPDILTGTSILLILGAMLVGASLVGADWHAGTMTTLLTWEPRRLRVLAAKAVVTVALVALLAVALFVLLSFVLWLVAATRGVTEEIDGTWLRSVIGVILRAAAAASIGALIGLAIAMIGRSTAAALGIGFAYLGVIEALIRGLRPGWEPWLLGDNVAIFVSGQPQAFGPEGHGVERTVLAAAAVAAAYAAVLLATAAGSFRARDVT